MYYFQMKNRSKPEIIFIKINKEMRSFKDIFLVYRKINLSFYIGFFDRQFF